LIFENVSPFLAQNSVQAAITGDAVIMEVRYNLKYATPLPRTADPARRKLERELKMVSDSLVELDFVAKGLQNRSSNFTTERQVLLQNRLMRGELQRDSLRLFTQSIDFLRVRLNDIDNELLQLDREKYRLAQQREPMQNRQQALETLLSANYNPEGTNPQPVPQIRVTVRAERSVSTQIMVHYFVPQAGWNASYDLRADKTSAEITLNHQAAVYQQTGLDWSNVLLTLSTGNPNQSNNKPVLTPAFLNFDYPVVYDDRARQKAATFSKRDADMAATEIAAQPQEEAEDEKSGVADFVTVNQNMLRIEYEISLPYSIQSDGKPHNVGIQERKIPAQYNYTVVPKLDPDVFLVARLTDWEDMNLLPGPARVYFDGSFVGETQLNPNNLGDTLQVNLGRDKSIVVKRSQVKDKSKEKTFSDQRVVTRTFEISLRNTKNLPIRILVEDQMPVAQDAAIKIDYLEYSKASFNPDSGKLTWDLKLDPKESKKLIFSYELKYPKDRVLKNF
ncbi:MAG: mucoidy inhibitor MuiA family protein, partial [Saprospiraceae bacterium]